MSYKGDKARLSSVTERNLNSEGGRLYFSVYKIDVKYFLLLLVRLGAKLWR